jgi:hypothetical protein
MSVEGTLSASFTLAIIVTVAFTLTGFAQVLWLRSKLSEACSQPLDFGAKFRGKRVFGDNKTLKGFIPFVPVAGLFFCLVGSLFTYVFPQRLDQIGWNLSSTQWLVMGHTLGLGYALAELPNSFIKRQLDISPGTTSKSLPTLSFVIDQIDSVIGVLIFMCFHKPPTLAQSIMILAVGACVHFLFNLFLFQIGFKSRAG